MWVVALTAVGRQDVDLNGLEGELVYLNTQLSWEIVERCAFVIRRRWWTAQGREEAPLARASKSGSLTRWWW
jgi:hypothetical protein